MGAEPSITGLPALVDPVRADPVPTEPREPPVHLGRNVYCWTDARQNALLAGAIRPLALELERRGVAHRLWVNRNDRRGPHVMLLLTLADPARRDEAETLLDDHLEAFLATHPPTAPTGDDRLLVERRAEAARGIVLCAPDREEGLAPEHSVARFEHPPDGYPWRLARELEDPEAVWERVGELMGWVVERVSEQPEGVQGGRAARLLAAVDARLPADPPDGAAGFGREGLWRWYVTSLLPRVAERLEDEPEALFDELPAIVGERNRASFEALWLEVEESLAAEEMTAESLAEGDPGLSALVARLEAETGATPEARHRLLRHVLHWTMKLLGVRLPVELPLVLFAWHRAWAARRDAVAVEETA